MSDAIHQEITIKASPAEVYRALTEAKRFSAMSGGAPAEIEAKAGGAFSLFGGHVAGRTLELEADRRVVQAWRAKDWAPGVYSVCRFELAAQGKGTKLVFDQTGVPAGAREHLEGGWHKMYWEPLNQMSA